MKCNRVLFAALLITALGTAPAPALKLGEPAPPLSVTEWAKGGPINLADGKGKNVYLVEFWATWCPPCQKSIPHLTELQKEYKDKGVIVIGVSNEDAATVKPFVEGKGAQMDYAVAIDNKDETTKAYMGAFEMKGIPVAFVVDKNGALVWHGHPMDNIEGVLDMALSGKKEDILKLGLMVEMRDVYPQWAKEYLSLAGLGVETKKADELGEKLIANAPFAPGGAIELAWRILNAQGIAYRNKELALRLAETVNKATNEKEPGVLGVYAQALFENGKAPEAISALKKAIELAKDHPDILSVLQQDLEKYEANAPTQ